MKQFPGDLADRTVGRERDLKSASVAVFDTRLVPMQVECDDERAGAVRSR